MKYKRESLTQCISLTGLNDHHGGMDCWYLDLLENHLFRFAVGEDGGCRKIARFEDLLVLSFEDIIQWRSALFLVYEDLKNKWKCMSLVKISQVWGGISN